MAFTSDQILTVLRKRLESDFKFFVRYFFKKQKSSKFVFNDHHHLICDKLMQVYDGEIQNLIINLPPRYSKTEIVIIMFSAWCYIKNQKSEFIHLSYSDPLVLDNSERIKSIIKSAEFQELWPHIQIKDNKDSKKSWATNEGGTFYATASGGSVTGFGAGRLDEWDGEKFTFSGCLLLDDPLKPDDARHDTLRKGVNRRWDETIKSRRNSPRTPTIVVMQRIHEEDFTAMLLADSELSWHHLKLPALVDEGLPTEHALWPGKHTVEQLKAMRDKVNAKGEANPIAKESFTAQYQQEPKTLGGNLIKESWWRYYASLEEVTKRCTFFFIVADTAYKAKDSNDPSVFQFWGAEGSKRLYLLDQIRGRWEFPDLLEQAKAFYKKHPVQRFYIEDKASGPSLAQTLRKQQIKITLWKPKDYGYPDDKVGRVKESSWHIHQGVIWLPSNDIHEWVDGFVSEHSAFSNDDTHANDDQVDCETMAVSVWTHYSRNK